MDVPQRRIAQQLKKNQPRRQQDEKKRLIGQPLPAVRKSDPEILDRPVARFFFALHANSRVFDTRFTWIAQSKSADLNFPRSTDCARGVFYAFFVLARLPSAASNRETQSKGYPLKKYEKDLSTLVSSIVIAPVASPALVRLC